jgi:3',5'-cyclic-AMP phosphodiesterase
VAANSAATRSPRHTVVQLTDTHVPAGGLLFGRVDAAARVEAAVEMLVSAGCSVDLLILSGDQADRGEADAYERLRPVLADALRQLGAPLLVVPGNHDDLGLLRTLVPDGAERVPTRWYTVVRVGGLRLIGLDSTVPGADHGELDDDQLRELAAELLEPAPDGTILVVHHPPIWSTTPASERVALQEPERLAAAIRGTDVRLVLSGHTHRARAGTLAGVPVWVGPSTASAADVLATHGFRGHAGGGFTRVDVFDDGEIVVTCVPLAGRDEVLYDVPIPETVPPG